MQVQINNFEYEMDFNSKIDRLYKSVGKQIRVDGQVRTLVSCRVEYGAWLNLKLSRPLENNCSPLVSINENNHRTVEVRSPA
jgi:hypothetical protein